MKAAVYRRYGPPDVVQIEDVPKPVSKNNEVLIKDRAASVNPLDWKVMSGGLYIIRTLLELGKPKIRRPGVDVAGRVESVGRSVTQFKPLVAKPENVTFEQAASAPVAVARNSAECLLL